MHRKGGFTLIEVGVVVTVLAILLSISTSNLIGFQTQAYLDTTTETLISDLKQQQLKAMSGDTEGTSATEPFGIALGSNQYTLYRGGTYNPSATSNFVIGIDDSIQISTTFPQSRILFIKGSGEIQSFANGSNRITLTHSASGEQKNITINRYGVIRAVD